MTYEEMKEQCRINILRQTDYLYNWKSCATIPLKGDITMDRRDFENKIQQLFNEYNETHTHYVDTNWVSVRDLNSFGGFAIYLDFCLVFSEKIQLVEHLHFNWFGKDDPEGFVNHCRFLLLQIVLKHKYEIDTIGGFFFPHLYS